MAAALGQEVEALGPDARRLAWGSAVAGEPVELELAAAAGGLSPTEAPAALDEVLAAGLLGPPRSRAATASGIRSCAAPSTTRPARRGGSGRTRARRPRSRSAGRRAAARAHHLEQCALPGDEAAIAVLIQAGLEAAPRAPAGAAQWFVAALRLLGDTADPGRRLGLLIPLATANAATGHLEEALAPCIRRSSSCPPSRRCAAPDRRVRRLREPARAPRRRAPPAAARPRRPADGRRAPRRSTSSSPPTPSTTATSRRCATGRRAPRDTAAALEDPGLRDDGAALACFADSASATPRPTRRAPAEGAAMLDTLPDEALAAARGPVLPELRRVLLRALRRRDQASPSRARGLARVGQGQLMIPMMVGLAHALETRGRLAEALEQAEGAVEAARLRATARSPAGRSSPRRARRSAGDSRALAAGEEAVDLLRGLDESVLTRGTHAHVAGCGSRPAGPTAACRRCRPSARPSSR